MAFDDILASVITDENGVFEKTVSNQTGATENGCDIVLKAYPGNDNTMVYDMGDASLLAGFSSAASLVISLINDFDFSYDPYYALSLTHNDIMSSKYDNKIPVTQGGVIAKSFSIGNALYYGRKYEAYINGGTTLSEDPVKAHYPFSLAGDLCPSRLKNLCQKKK